MAKNLLAITVAGQIKWLREAVLSLHDDLDVLVIDDATPGNDIKDFCDQNIRMKLITKLKPMGGVNSWNMAYQYFKENNYDNCILGNDDVRFPAGFSKGILEGLEKFDLVGPLSNEPGTGLCQDVRRFVDIKPSNRNIDEVQKILSERYRNNPFRQSYFVNGFCLAFSTSIAKFTYNDQFLLNPANINVGNEYDFANRVNRREGKIAVCKVSYVFHWKGKTTEKLSRDCSLPGDYREQLWRKNAG